MFRFLIMPGHVRSISDEDIHYISAQELIKLYRVDPKKCLIWNQDMGENISDKLIKLRPRKDGKYFLYRYNYVEGKV